MQLLPIIYLKKMGILCLFLGPVFICYFSMLEAKRGRSQSPTNAHSFNFVSLDAQPLPLSDFKGKVVLVVNTASQCGLTPQYKELEELYQRYKDQGLVILGVPSNDFGQQEPGNSEEITCFLEEHYPVTFPITEKEVVSGKNAHPFYLWAGKKVWFFGRPAWNFHKYLIGKNGEFIDWFASTTLPLSPKITRAIEKALAK
jgi:glutathione peroxidase